MSFFNNNPTLCRIKVVSAALIASPTPEMLEDYAALYMDGTLPYRLYRSNGTSLVEIASGGSGGGVAVSGGASSQSTGTIIFSNASGITFGLNGGTMTATVKTDYASSNHSHGNPTLNLTNLSGTTASNSAGLTLSLSAANPAAGAAISAAGNSVSNGTVVFSNSNGVSFGMNGSTITATVTPGAAAGIAAAQAGTQTATSGTIVFANSNGLTFGMSGSSQITASHNGLTTARASNDAIGLNTAQTNVTWTVNSSGLSLNAAGYAGTSTGFTGGASISGSMTNNSQGLAVSLSHPAWLTTAAVSNHSHGASASNGSFAFQTLNFSNANNVTFGTSAGSIVTASVAPPGAVTLTNYATGNTTQSSSGTIAGSSVIMRGSGGVSAGISNGSYIVEGPALTSISATGALSASSNGSTISLGVGTVTASATGNTTQGSSGTINLNGLIFQGTGGASVGISNGSVVISGATGGGAGYSAGVSTGGNTSGDTGVVTGRLVLAGGNNITLSGSTNGGSMTVTISGANAGGAQTGISGIANSQTTYTSGSVTFSELGAITIRSTTGQQFQFSVPQTSSLSATGNASISTNGSTISIGANAAAVSLSGNSTSAGAGYSNVSSGTLILAGGNNITLSQNGASVTISGANAGGAQTGISGIVVSDATYTSGTVTFQNANGISFGSSGANGISASYTRPVVSNAIQPVGSATGSGTNTSRFAADDHVHEGVFSVGLSTGGNTSGDTRVGPGRFVLQGGNNVTLSQITAAGALNTIVISGGAAGGADGVNALVVNAGASTASTTLTLSNSNNVTFGLNAGVITASASFAQSNQTLSAAATGNTAGNSSGMTVDARSLTLQGLGGASVGFSTSAGGSSVIISAPAAQTNVAFSADASSTFQTLTFQNSNNVSFSNNAGAIRVTHNLAGTSTGSAGANVGISMTHNSSGLNLSITTPAQTNQTIGVYGSSQTAGSISSGTHDARSLSIIGAGIISVGNHSTSAGGTTTGVIISAGATSFSNLNNISFGLNGSTITASFNPIDIGVSNLGNTAGTTGTMDGGGGRVVFVGGNNITLSQSSAASVMTITISAPDYAVSNSAGSFTFKTLNFSNANNVTFGTSAGGIITASVAAPGAAAEANAINLLGANTSGNTTATGSTIGWSGVNLTLSGTNNSQVVISAPATSSLVGASGLTISTNGSTVSIGQILGSYVQNMDVWANSTTMTMFQSTSHMVPFFVAEPMSIGVLRMFVTQSVAASSTAATTGNTQFSYGHSRSHNFVIYTRGSGASSMSLQSYTSTQHTDQQSINVSANANSTQFSYTNRLTYVMSTGTSGATFDYSSSAASLNFHTSNMTGITGNKILEFPFAMSLTPGLYFLAYGVSSTTASQFTNQGTRLFNVASNYGVSQPNIAFGFMESATNSSAHLFPGLGSFTTSGAAGTTASVQLSAVSTSSAHNRMIFQMSRVA